MTLDQVLLAVLPPLSALGGVALTLGSEHRRERGRRQADLADRDETRRRATADRVREFELEQLLLAYDAIWRLLRRASEVHLHDVRSAKAGQGYGGTQIGNPAGSDVETARDATRAVRLILNDDIRRAAEQVLGQAGALSSMGAVAREAGRGLVTEEEGERAFNHLLVAADTVMREMAARIRALVAAG